MSSDFLQNINIVTGKIRGKSEQENGEKGITQLMM
jgi:hypothetical protein